MSSDTQRQLSNTLNAARQRQRRRIVVVPSARGPADP